MMAANGGPHSSSTGLFTKPFLTYNMGYIVFRNLLSSVTYSSRLGFCQCIITSIAAIAVSIKCT